MLALLRLTCLLLVIISSSSFAALNLSVVGLTGELATNVEARLTLIDPTSISNTPYFKRYLESQIRKALKAVGYYAPKFSYQVIDKNSRILVTVTPGAPVLIDEVNINIQGAGKNDDDFLRLIKLRTPKKGDVLNHGVYEAFKRELQNFALSKGYFKAKMSKHQLAVADKNNQAYWNIDFDTGERYKFGKIILHPAQIESDFLVNLITFQEGEAFDADKIRLFNRRLSSTNWFSSVVIAPDFTNETKNREVPIDISTIPRGRNNMDLGIGYSTDSGTSAKIGWNKPLINSLGHSFQSNLYTSESEDIVSLSYKMPLRESPLEDYYTVQSGIKNVDDNDTYSRLFTLGAFRNWDKDNGWKISLGVNYMHDVFVQAYKGYTTDLYYPSLNIYKVNSDGRLLTMHGFSQNYSLETGSQYLLSDIDITRLQVQYNWISSIGSYNRFIARTNISIIKSSDFDRVPPTLRFFAGGDRSIRGYNYQSISPKDKNGNLIGAPKLITGTLEYQYGFSEEWWGALFVDTGQAVNNWNENELHTGIGFGLRWASPIGSIKIDLATPYDSIDTSSIHAYIGLGTEL